MKKPSFKVGDVVYSQLYYGDEPLIITKVIKNGDIYNDGEKYEYNVKLENNEIDTLFEKHLSL